MKEVGGVLPPLYPKIMLKSLLFESIENYKLPKRITFREQNVHIALDKIALSSDAT